MFDIIIILLINFLGYRWFSYWFFLVEFIGLIILFFWLWWKKYRPVVDSVSLFTGAPGTGKTKVMTDFALNKFRTEYRIVKIKNFFIKLVNKLKRTKIELHEIPILISNYPIKISRKKYSRILTNDIVLLQERLPYKSVIAITEFSSIANNQDYKNEFAKVNVDEWVRFIRQYTLGGWLFMDDQSSDLILAQVRRRIGKVYNMMSFRKIPLLKIGIVNIRHISISEDIKVVEEGHAESLKNTSWFPVFFYTKTYDTYAFSGRVKNMKVANPKMFQSLKTNELMEIPFTKDKSKLIATKTIKKDLDDVSNPEDNN